MDRSCAKGASQTRQNMNLISHKRRRKKVVRGHITKGVLRRLARRGGVKRLSALIYDEMRDVIKIFLTSVVRDAIIYCEYSRRSTVMAEDVIRALRNRGQRLYGFDEVPIGGAVRTSIRLSDSPERSVEATTAVPDTETSLEDSDTSVEDFEPNTTTSSAAAVNNILPRRKSTLGNSNVTEDSAMPTRSSRSTSKNPAVSRGNAGGSHDHSSKPTAAGGRASFSGTKSKRSSTTPGNDTERIQTRLRPGNVGDSGDITTPRRKKSKAEAGTKAAETPIEDVAASSLDARVSRSKSTANRNKEPEDTLYHSDSTTENTVPSFRSPYRNVGLENISPVVQLENVDQAARPFSNLRSREENDSSSDITSDIDYEAGLTPVNPFDDD